MIKGYLFASIERLGLSATRLLSIIILSRYITPEDLGIFSIASVITAISIILVDSGMGGAIIRENSPSSEDYSTVFITNLTIALILFIIAYISSPIVSSFYNQNKLDNAIKILSISLIIKALTLTYTVKLVRQMRFGEQAIVNLASATIALACAYTLAHQGYGLWALIWQQIIEVTLILIGSFFLIKEIPGIKFNKLSFKKLFNFGFNLTLASLIRTLYENIIVLIIGKIHSQSMLGNYTQANRLNNFYSTFITGVIDKVAFARLSKKYNENIAEYNRYSLKILEAVSSIGAFVALFTILYAEEIITFTIGTGWNEAAEILKILSFSGIWVIMETATRIIFKSAGKSSAILKLEIVKKGISLIIIATCIPLGIKGLLYGIVIASIISSSINFYQISKKLLFTRKHLIIALTPALTAATVTTIIAKMIVNIPIKNQYLSITIPLIIMIATYYLTQKTTSRLLKDKKQ